MWSHWNLWVDGVVVLGLNASLFWTGLLVLVWRSSTVHRIGRDWPWILPIGLLVASFTLYENPWLKLVSQLVLPVCIGVFGANSRMVDTRDAIWNLERVRVFGVKLLNPLLAAKGVVRRLLVTDYPLAGSVRQGIARRILRGLLMLLPLGILVPSSLVSADAGFAEVVDRLLRHLTASISWVVRAKLVLTMLLTVLPLSVSVSWQAPIRGRDATWSR